MSTTHWVSAGQLFEVLGAPIPQEVDPVFSRIYLKLTIYSGLAKSRLNDRGVSESNPDVWLSLHQLDCGAKRVVSLLRYVHIITVHMF